MKKIALLLCSESVLNTALVKNLSEQKDLVIVDIDNKDKTGIDEIMLKYTSLDNITEDYHPFNLKPPLPDLSQEKKRTRPCKRHEYVLVKTTEISPNLLKEIWECRHCNHPLN